MKLKLSVFLIAFISTISIAQTKVGTINSDYIINIMPEAQIVISRTQAYGEKLDSSFNIKVEDFKTRLKDYQDREKEMGPLEKKTIQQEINALDQDVKNYKKTGTTLIGLKRDELMRPLYKKLNDAISEICKENNYTQVFTTSVNSFAYIDSKFDITDLVIKKLRITIPEPQK